MDARVLDIAAGFGSLAVFVISLWLLPGVIEQGIAYLVSIFLFIIVMSAAGWYMAGSTA